MNLEFNQCQPKKQRIIPEQVAILQGANSRTAANQAATDNAPQKNERPL
jgi:hypothetical protein